MSYVYLNGEPMKELEHLSSLVHSMNSNGHSGPSLFKRSSANGANSDDEDSKKAKTMDIYKARQYKKLIKNA